MSIDSTIVNFCPTGMVPTKAMTPHVPVSVIEIVEQVHEAFELGITIAHLHARDEAEAPTWRPETYRNILEGVRAHCPGLIVCFSTSGRTFPEFEKRSAVIETGPDMCSLTLSSLNFAKNGVLNSPEMIQRLAIKMKQYGVTPELECFDLGMMNYGRYLIEKGIIEGPCYWNLLFGNVAGMQLEPTHIQAAISSIPEHGKHHISFGGIGRSSIRAAQAAIDLGVGIRVGLEDNIWADDDRTTKATNLSLLKDVHEIIRSQKGSVMSSKA